MPPTNEPSSATSVRGSVGIKISGPDTSVTNPAAFFARTCIATYPLISTPASASTAATFIASIIADCVTRILVASAPMDSHGLSCEVVRTLACVDAVCPNVLYTFAADASNDRRRRLLDASAGT